MIQTLNELKHKQQRNQCIWKEGDINQHAYLTKQKEISRLLNPQGNNERTQQLIEATERVGCCAQVMGAGGWFLYVGLLK